MNAPRRKVVSARQMGDSMLEYQHDWTCVLSCGHTMKYGKSYKNTPAPKTLGCFRCVK